ncbi:unnamed protein product [Rangifer tarandus platyrhynchus]|uniref:Uncharacterized protein n=1 Tax=Rangifer tarandus platyrhynchus TaxID=3082113 RepID=A0ABN8Y9B7_RANTA|nr:unnamed protein product [Rangifer tarandus platyrhynchus]
MAHPPHHPPGRQGRTGPQASHRVPEASAADLWLVFSLSGDSCSGDIILQEQYILRGPHGKDAFIRTAQDRLSTVPEGLAPPQFPHPPGSSQDPRSRHSRRLPQRDGCAVETQPGNRGAASPSPRCISILNSTPEGGEGDGKQPRSSFLTSPPGLLFQEEHWASRRSLAQLWSGFACVASVETHHGEPGGGAEPGRRLGLGAETPEEMKGLMEASPQETLLETSSPRDNRSGSPPGVSTCHGPAGQCDDGDSDPGIYLQHLTAALCPEFSVLSRPCRGLARELREGGVAPGTVAGTRGGLEGGPAARRAAICSWAPSTARCREERELAAPPARAEPRPLRAPTVLLPTGSREAGRAVLAASDFLSEKYTEQRAHSCAPSAQK